MKKGAKHVPQWCPLYYEDVWVSKDMPCLSSSLMT